MASYHCSVKVGGKGQASSHAAYIAREGHYAERDDYEDLEATGHGNLPAWTEGEPARFWSAADRYERANGATYREIEIALPRELNPDQRQALVLDFIRHEIGERHAHQLDIKPGECKRPTVREVPSLELDCRHRPAPQARKACGLALCRCSC